MELIPVILCGGAGSRLWPVSREMHPKPFIRLPDGQSLLQKAFLRAASLPGVKDVLTVTNEALFFKIEDEFQEIADANHIKTSFILEPFGRNTAAAIAGAALHLAEHHDRQTCLLILAADHLIGNQDAFQQAVSEAMTLAQTGQMVTFGIQPDSPQTGYGYIEADGHQVLNFYEKPSLEKAQAYVDSKRFFWNSGMFLFTLDAILQEMETHCPDILSAIQQCMAVSKTLKTEHASHLRLNSDAFSRVPENSIDYAVMEKSEHIAMVPAAMDWSDVGSWDSIKTLAHTDSHGNGIVGDTMLYDVSNCYIQSHTRLVGAVGVDNLIIVDTPDAVLVADKNRAQDVKHLYTQLKSQGHDAHKLHRTVHRPWGTYTVLEEGKQFKIKRIEVKPNGCLSLQMHYHRNEHWIVVSGIAKVVNDTREFFVNTNESTYIPAGNKHRLENPGLLPLVMIEVQSGDYLGEDDIVRFEDMYGRV